jgi:hypothetical protein
MIAAGGATGEVWVMSLTVQHELREDPRAPTEHLSRHCISSCKADDVFERGLGIEVGV